MHGGVAVISVVLLSDWVPDSGKEAFASLIRDMTGTGDEVDDLQGWLLYVV